MKAKSYRRDKLYTIALDGNNNVIDYSSNTVPVGFMSGNSEVKSVDFMQNENPGYLIGSYAFYDCSLVGDLVIPDSFTGIRKNSFTKSYGINDIYINLPVESIFGTTSTNSPVNPFYDGPVGKLYIAPEYIDGYGSIGDTYPATLGMEIDLWREKGVYLEKTYSLTTPFTVEEGNSMTVDVITQNVLDGTVLYWGVYGDPNQIGELDLLDLSPVQGSITINNNQAQINITILTDESDENTERFYIGLFEDNSYQNVLRYSNYISIIDIYPTYEVIHNTSVDEGSSLFVTVNTTNLDDTTLYWSSTEQVDIEQSNGSFSIINNQGSFSIPITVDLFTDPGETFTFVIREDSIIGDIVAQSNTITINDVLNPPSYTIIPQDNFVDEGSALSVNIQTQNVIAGTVLYWSVTNPSQFNVSSGTVTMNSSSETFFVSPKMDSVVGDSDSFQINISTVSGGQPVQTSGSISITDRTPTISFVNNSQVNEGSILVVTVNTTNTQNQTLYWTLSSTTDFVASSGSFSLNNNSGSFNVQPEKNDGEDPGENFVIEIRTASTSGPTIGISDQIDIIDVTDPADYIFPTLPESIDEGSDLVVTISTPNVVDTTVLYWTVTNPSEFLVSSGSFTITGEEGTFTVSPELDDKLDDNLDPFLIQIRTGSISGPIQKESLNILINNKTTDNENPNSIWNKIGGDIEAIGSSDFGQSVSLSDDGNTLAVGDDKHSSGGSNIRGKAKVYRNSAGSWIQIGQDILGDNTNDQGGYSVSLSSDGNRLAIGYVDSDINGVDSGLVRIYEYNGTEWNKIGQDIAGSTDRVYLGWSVDLSSNGNIVAASAPFEDTSGGIESGSVFVYEYNGSNWLPLGQEIEGEEVNNHSGFSISISSDGTFLAIGAPGNAAAGTNSGHVRVWQYNGSNWSQLGSDINGESAGDESGSSVSISADGSIVAIGAYLANEAGLGNSGHVRVYQYDGANWNKIGQDIFGNAASNDHFGYSVSLSNDGSILAAGARLSDANNNTDSGFVGVYQYDGVNWIQLGSDIYGEGVSDKSGHSVSLSSNGTIVAIGAPDNDGAGIDAGHVRVWEYSSSSTTLYRVNAGGPNVTAIDGGIDWEPDTSASPSQYNNSPDVGNNTYVPSTPTITNSTISTPPQSYVPENVFFNHRYDLLASNGEMTWTFPVQNGQYTVNLYFAEIYHSSAGQRFYDVILNGTEVITNMDKFATAGGKNIAYLKTFDTTVTNGSIIIEFIHGSKDHPEVNAIEIIQNSIG